LCDVYISKEEYTRKRNYFEARKAVFIVTNSDHYLLGEASLPSYSFCEPVPKHVVVLNKKLIHQIYTVVFVG